MEKFSLADRTILILETEAGSTLEMQDRIIRSGGRVVTARNLPQALLAMTAAPLADALIEWEFEGADAVIAALRERHVPFGYFVAASPRGLDGTSQWVPSPKFSKTSGCDQVARTAMF